LNARSEKQRKENKEKTNRQRLTKTSFERFHEADDKGGTARDLLQHLRNLKQYPSKYAEYSEYMKIMQKFRSEYEDYATISFRICRICDKMVQKGSKLWICPELSVSSKYFHPFCPDPLFQCSFSLETRLYHSSEQIFCCCVISCSLFEISMFVIII